ncbi:hypothetical protein X777_06482 [Ooceraea biroi]|uniref:Uncharacterized protein n=1 Tax=Ooceraea biroi TaxID=2015173 RepID=A0A026WCJ6_OOCBI|nr:hypothetical protein X777_06482 [Ooceraea biroi]
MRVAATACPSPTCSSSGTTTPWCSTTAVRLLCVVLVSCWIVLDRPALGLPDSPDLSVQGKLTSAYHCFTLSEPRVKRV